MRSLLALALVALLASCAGPQAGSSLTLIHNVKGYTCTATDSLRTFTALAWDANGRIVAVGDEAHLLDSLSAATRIDGQGKTLLTGLIDAHGHVMGLGALRSQVDLVGTRSLEAALQRVEAWANENPEAAWVTGRGWNHELWPSKTMPTAQDLDRVVPDRPVFLRRVDGHAAVANTAAMEAAGITAQSQDPRGGLIQRDAQGKPNGIFIDQAMGLVAQHLPARGEAADSLALLKALEELRAVGITSIHDAGVGYDDWQRYKRFAERGALTARIYGMISGAGQYFDTLSIGGPIPSAYNDLLALRAVKLYADGALGSRGAALIEPYTDLPGSHGLLFHPDDSLRAYMAKVQAAGYQVCVHAIGDAANRQVLDAYAALQEAGANIPSGRHRIEHAQIVHPDDFARYRALGIIPSMQPTHATSDKNMAEDRLGPDRIRGAYAWRTFLAQGSPLPFGSDFPVEQSNPFHGLFAAVSRQDTLGTPPQGWYPSQALTLPEAYRAFTLDAAYAGFQEDILGSLEPGKWADFILIDRDIFALPAEQIWQAQVLATYLAGQRVYQAQEGE